LRVPDELLGKAVRCPSCLSTFSGKTGPLEGAPSTPPTVATTLPSSGAVSPPPNLSLEGGEPARPPSSSGTLTAPAAPTGELRPCPSCGERIGRNDERCRYCGETVAEEEERPWEQPPARPSVRRDCEPHRAQLILTLGIIGLGAMACASWMGAVVGMPCGIIAWVLGTKDLARMRLGTMDPEGLGMTQSGRICGMVATLIGGLMVLGCLAYFGFIAIMMAAQR
jgi:hypothetical protein